MPAGGLATMGFSVKWSDRDFFWRKAWCQSLWGLLLGLVRISREGFSIFGPRAFNLELNERRVLGLSTFNKSPLPSPILRTISQPSVESVFQSRGHLSYTSSSACKREGWSPSCTNGEWGPGGALCWTDRWLLSSNVPSAPPHHDSKLLLILQDLEAQKLNS